MTKKTFVAIACLAAVIAACGPKDATQDFDPETLPLPGSDRDAYNCISSAGYQWSQVLGDCVRLFEDGVALMDMQNAESSSTTYIIPDPDGERLELFSTNGTSTILMKTAQNEWQDKDSLFTARLEMPTRYTVYNSNGVNIYTQDRNAHDVNFDLTLETDSDETLTEFGIISDIEDGAYPMFSANMEFPERNMVIPFTINIEALSLSPGELTALEGQYVSIDYTSTLEKNVYEMEIESGFLMGTTDRQYLKDLKTVRGIMGGAQVTMGDLPGSFYLEDAENNRIYFTEYVTDEMMAGDGRNVIIYYDTRTQNTITKITKAQD